MTAHCHVITTSWESAVNTVIRSPYAVFLDASDPTHYDGVWSYVGFDPYMTITISSGTITSKYRNGQVQTSTQSVTSYLAQLESQWLSYPKVNQGFMGGIMGYLSYEATRYWADFSHLVPPHVNASDLTHHPSGLPDICFGVYDRALRHHHPTNTTELIVRQDITGDTFSISDFQKRNQHASLPVSPSQSEFALTSSVNMPSYTQYQEKFDAIKRWIQNGHVYQINLSEQFNVAYRGDMFAFYQNLRQNTPAPFAAYLNYPFVQICSASPELMVSKAGGHICSRPIKGTIPRDTNYTQDLKNQHALFHSEKDRAELTMIVDLIRNDLRRICRTGSIAVDSVNNYFHRIETFSHLHHLVADVRGKLNVSCSLVGLLQSVFPGGSITGAPKIRATELISQIENIPRFIYTGSIGYLGFDGDIKLNIAIRTLYAHNNIIYFHSGSGIVADSTAPAEWDEIRVKAEGIYSTLCHANT